MIPLQVELQRAVKATKDEAMTIYEAAEHLKVNVEEVPMIVAQADDLKMVGKDAIIAKRDKTNGWLIGVIAVVLFLTIAVLPGVIGSN
ncbi:hypothetical protein ACUUYQ_06370 [Bacillus halotolerans]|uniref:hypothetical protein n=1 Tax=Bacillus TaxID=1386 RepID=UPI000D03C8F2|nr:MULTISPECIES: hypothetical protein [Bacillus]MBV7320567.1 hypothetical protein [Halalkalibacterium halodurans]AZV47674.1 hypothetical protein DIC78_00855 [Bacillus halotolerans]MCP9299780.1 hypothetical protein [Bacillus halotolerans]MCR6596536.1 hypothetical protein [Bacillus halotolerans]MCV0024512.1 hypothetical protein [Bacillus sp. XT-2]